MSLVVVRYAGTCTLIAYMCSPCLYQNRPARRRRTDLAAESLLVILSFAMLLIPAEAKGAEYQGQKVDGMRYRGFVRSLDTGKYYPASVIFEQNRASVRPKSGRRLDLLLDQEIVEDPEEVLATDPRGRTWALSVDGLDEPSNGSETFAVADSLVNSRGFLLRALRRSIVGPS